MRFNTVLEALCWINRVSSPGMIEKLCQLRMDPGELVIRSWFPEVTVLTWPATTCMPVGLAAASPASMHRNPVASVVRRAGKSRRDEGTRAGGTREPVAVRFPRLLEDIWASSVISINKPGPAWRAGVDRLSPAAP